MLDGELIGIYAQGDHAENAVKNSKEMFSDEVCICNTIEEVMKYRYRVILADSFPAIDENTLLLKAEKYYCRTWMQERNFRRTFRKRSFRNFEKESSGYESD